MGQIVSLILKLADYITDMSICMKIQYYKNNFVDLILRVLKEMLWDNIINPT